MRPPRNIRLQPFRTGAPRSAASRDVRQSTSPVTSIADPTMTSSSASPTDLYGNARLVLRALAAPRLSHRSDIPTAARYPDQQHHHPRTTRRARRARTHLPQRFRSRSPGSATRTASAASQPQQQQPRRLLGTDPEGTDTEAGEDLS